MSLISFAPADGFEVGRWFGIGLVNSHGRHRDGVVFAFVHWHRALARRGIGVPIIEGLRCLLIGSRRRSCVGGIGGVTAGQAGIIVRGSAFVAGRGVRTVGACRCRGIAVQGPQGSPPAPALQFRPRRQLRPSPQTDSIPHAPGGPRPPRHAGPHTGSHRPGAPRSPPPPRVRGAPGPFQGFGARQYGVPPTRDAFAARMIQLREQASMVQAQRAGVITEVVSRVRTVGLVAKAESLYWYFEDAADPCVTPLGSLHVRPR